MVRAISRHDRRTGPTGADSAPPGGMLTVREVCERLGISKPDGVLKLIHSGALPASNVSAGARPTWRIAETDLAAFLDRRRAVPPPAPSRRARRRPLEQVTKFF